MPAELKHSMQATPPVAAQSVGRTGARLVVLLGPAHRVAFRGLAAPSSSVFMTPLGAVAIDRAAIEQLVALPQVHMLDEAHRLEHALSDEVVRRLDAWLGHPAVDPHGTPIPRPRGRRRGDAS